MESHRDSDAKRSVITQEHREEAAKLLSIFNRMKPTLRARGYGTQESFGAMFEIGTQAAVGNFLHARTALSLKAAVAFAAGLDCRVSDFSPRLAAQLNEPKNLPGRPSAGGDESAPPSMDAAVSAIARSLLAAPDHVREQMGKELALLSSIPDSPTLINRIATALAPFSEAAAVPRHSQGPAALPHSISKRLEGISDSAERDRLITEIDAMLEREAMARAMATPASTPAQPTRSSRTPHR